MTKLALVAALALILSACGGTICETPFGLADPPRNEDGDTYWVSTCVPEDQYGG